MQYSVREMKKYTHRYKTLFIGSSNLTSDNYTKNVMLHSRHRFAIKNRHEQTYFLSLIIKQLILTVDFNQLKVLSNETVFIGYKEYMSNVVYWVRIK